MDRFQEILWDLGEEIDVPLHIDTNNACKIVLENDLSILLQSTEDREKGLRSYFNKETPDFQSE